MTLLKFFQNDSASIQKKRAQSDLSIKYEKIYNWRYPLALASLVLIVLLYVEFKHPYFFLQDDNRDYYLPYFVHNFKSLLNGELALYNFHQFLGVPSLAVGQTGALYPITYFSVFLSKFIFGHYFAAVDIQVILHLIIGAVGLYSFMKFLDVDCKVAFFAGLTWSLSSYIMFASNSWVIVSAVAAYFPWMLLFSFKLYREPTLKRNIYAILARVILFYAGHIQYFIYSVIFEFITVITYVISDSEPAERKSKIIKFLMKYIQGYICVLILCLPLLLPMWNQTIISAQRSGKLAFNVFVSQYFPLDQLLKGLIYPFSQVNDQTYASYRNLVNLSHIGYMPIIILLTGIVERIIRKSKKDNRISVRFSIFIRPALLAFIWSTNWIFNYIIYSIPILNRFRWPFKLVLYFDFYLIVIATLILANIIERLSWKNTKKSIILYLVLAIQIFNFVFLYTVTPYKDFGEHHGDTLPLEEKLVDKINEGRIISIGFDIWTPTSENNHSYLTAPSLGFNYATLWGLDHFAGYEPLIPKSNAEATFELNFSAILGADKSVPIDYLRKVGVKWYIVSKDKESEYTKLFYSYGIEKKYSDENRVVFYDEKAYPMVYKSNLADLGSQNYKVTTNTIEFSVDNIESDTIVLNYLYNPFFKGYIDGEEIELIVEEDDDIHFSVYIPKGKHNILIKYKDPYLIAGTYIAIIFLILFLTFVILRYVQKNSKLRKSEENMFKVG